MCSVIERNATPPFFQVGDDRQKVRQRAAETVEFPDDQNVAVSEIGEASLQPRSIILGAGGPVLMEMTFIHTCSDQCITLQIDRLTLIGSGDPHVANEHVPKTPRNPCFHLLRQSDRVCRLFSSSDAGLSFLRRRARGTGIK